MQTSFAGKGVGNTGNAIERLDPYLPERRYLQSIRARLGLEELRDEID